MRIRTEAGEELTVTATETKTGTDGGVDLLITVRPDAEPPDAETLADLARMKVTPNRREDGEAAGRRRPARAPQEGWSRESGDDGLLGRVERLENRKPLPDRELSEILPRMTALRDEIERFVDDGKRLLQEMKDVHFQTRQEHGEARNHAEAAGSHVKVAATFTEESRELRDEARHCVRIAAQHAADTKERVDRAKQSNREPAPAEPGEGERPMRVECGGNELTVTGSHLADDGDVVIHVQPPANAGQPQRRDDKPANDPDFQPMELADTLTRTRALRSQCEMHAEDTQGHVLTAKTFANNTEALLTEAKSLIPELRAEFEAGVERAHGFEQSARTNSITAQQATDKAVQAADDASDYEAKMLNYLNRAKEFMRLAMDWRDEQQRLAQQAREQRSEPGADCAESVSGTRRDTAEAPERELKLRRRLDEVTEELKRQTERYDEASSTLKKTREDRDEWQAAAEQRKADLQEASAEIDSLKDGQDGLLSRIGFVEKQRAETHKRWRTTVDERDKLRERLRRLGENAETDDERPEKTIADTENETAAG